MKPLRNLLDELVERRLWPVALVLVLALIAVPLFLRTETAAEPASSASDTTAAPAGAPGAALAESAVVHTASSGRGLRRLPKTNPFVQRGVTALSQGVAAAAAGPGPATATASSSSFGSLPSGPSLPSTGGTGSSGSSGGSTGGASGGSSGGSSSGPGAPKTYATASLRLSFGRVDRARRARTLPRLAPLPDSSNPVLIYLGLVKGTKTAVFLLSSDVKAEGDGVCKPSPRNCQTVWLREGQVEFFDVTSPSGRVTQYQLDLLDVRYRRTTSRAAAARAFMPMSKRSKQAVKHTLAAQSRAAEAERAPVFGDFRWSEALGRVLGVPAPGLPRDVLVRPRDVAALALPARGERAGDGDPPAPTLAPVPLAVPGP